MTRRGDDGSASLELVILAPFLLVLMMLMLVFARYSQTESVIDQASRDATRAATAQNVKGDVPAVVDKVVKQTLDDAPDSCRSSASRELRMTDGAYGLPDPNNPLAIDSVSVTVRCTVSFADLAGIPLSSVRVERTFTSPLDRYRGYR